MALKTTISSKGQIVLPVELRRQDGIATGQSFRVERIEAGQYLLRREPAGNSVGLMDWLRACPGDGWFQPIPSESTEEL